LDQEEIDRLVSSKAFNLFYGMRFSGEEEDVVALLIDYGDGNVKVRCPDMVFRGSRICGVTGSCPYGEILYL
jgi:hypothetical protein